MSTIRLIVISLLFICLSAAAQEATDTTLIMSDGIAIDALYVLPTTSPPSGGYPAVVFIHGFGGSKNNNRENARLYAKNGYLTTAYSVRGQGDSGGEFDFFTSERIISDLREVLAFTKSIPNVNQDRIGVIGSSQGGILAWSAAAHQLGARAVISIIANGRFDENWADNNSMNWLFARMIAITPVRLKQEFRDSVNNAAQTGDISFVRSLLESYSTKSLEASVTTPVAIFVSYFDEYFNPSMALKQFAAIPAAGKIVLYPAAHADPAHPNQTLFLNSVTERWFDYWLKDNPAVGSVASPDSAVVFFDGATNLPHVFSRADTAHWLNAPENLPPSLKKQSFYLSPEGIVQEPPSAASQRQISYIRFVGSQPVVFRSQPFATDVTIAGVPGFAQLYSDGSASRYQMNLLLFDHDPVTDVRLPVTRGYYQVEGNVQGTPDLVEFNLNSVMHTIKTGHVLEARAHSGVPFLVNPANEFGNAALGPVENSVNTLYLGGNLPSGFALYFYDPSAVNSARDIRPTRNFTILRNYPNPFNPSTTIEYSVEKRSYVTLKIFSLFGNEIATLQCGMVSPGVHSIRWDAADMPSGLYVCRLQTDEAVTLHKILLVR